MKAFDLEDIQDVPGPDLHRAGSLFSDLQLMINLMLKYLGFARSSCLDLLSLVRSGFPHRTATVDFHMNFFVILLIFSMPLNPFEGIWWTYF